MSTLEYKDFEGISDLISLCLKQGDVEKGRSLIRTLRFVSNLPVGDTADDACKILYKVSQELRDILSSKRMELDEQTYKSILQAFEESLIPHDDSHEEQGEYLTTGDAAKKIGVSNQTVLNMIKDGRIKAIKPPGSKHWRIPASQFNKTDQQIKHLRQVVQDIHSNMDEEVTEKDLEDI